MKCAQVELPGEVIGHAGMRLRRYSNTASVPLATIAALGARKGFPSRLRHLRFNTHTETMNVSQTPPSDIIYYYSNKDSLVGVKVCNIESSLCLFTVSALIAPALLT